MLSPHFLTGAMLAAAFVTTGCGGDWDHGELRRESQAVEIDTSEMVTVELTMGAGELRVSGGSPKLVEADFQFRAPLGKPEIQYRPGVRGSLKIGASAARGRAGAGEWDLRLNNDKPLDVTTHLGAGEAHLDFSSLNLRGVEVHMGVGELRLDLRGKPQRSYDVRINGGVGEARVYLPKSVGIVATAKGGIGDISVHGLEKRGGYWTNPGHENDPITIRLDAKGGVGEINLMAE